LAFAKRSNRVRVNINSDWQKEAKVSKIENKETTLTIKDLIAVANSPKLREEEAPLFVQVGANWRAAAKVFAAETSPGVYGLVIACNTPQVGRPPKYASAEERQAARREKQKEYTKTYREKQKRLLAAARNKVDFPVC
jgi:hypothetical protein